MIKYIGIYILLKNHFIIFILQLKQVGFSVIVSILTLVKKRKNLKVVLKLDTYVWFSYQKGSPPRETNPSAKFAIRALGLTLETKSFRYVYIRTARKCRFQCKIILATKWDIQCKDFDSRVKPTARIASLALGIDYRVVGGDPFWQENQIYLIISLIRPLNYLFLFFVNIIFMCYSFGED